MTVERVIDGRPDGIRAAGTSRRKGLLKRTALGTLAVLSLAGLAQFGAHYWRIGRFIVATDDAYVQADNTLVAPRVSGYINAVLVADNQPVKSGQVLAVIDDRDYRIAVRQAVADRETAESEIRSIDAQLALQNSMIEQATQQVTSADAALRFARQDYERYDQLSRSGAGTTKSAQETGSLLVQRSAGLLHARAALSAAKQQVDVLHAARSKAEAQLEHYRAAEQQAGLNLGYTTITAPVDGTVGARSLRIGQYVQSGTQLMAVVPLDAVYIVANYKETQFTRVRPGQPVELYVDTFPGHKNPRPRRQRRAGDWPAVRSAPARQCHGQLHQDRSAAAGEDPAGSLPAGANGQRRRRICCARGCRSNRRSIPGSSRHRDARAEPPDARTDRGPHEQSAPARG